MLRVEKESKCKLKKTPQFYGRLLGHNVMLSRACADEYSTSSTSPGRAQKKCHPKEEKNLSRRALARDEKKNSIKQK